MGVEVDRIAGIGRGEILCSDQELPFQTQLSNTVHLACNWSNENFCYDPSF